MTVEFRQLKSAPAESPTAEPNLPDDSTLIGGLRGRLPFSAEPPKSGYLPVQSEEYLVDPYREVAYRKLTQKGYTKNQIQFALDVSRKTEAMPLGRTIGGTVGSIGVPLLLGQLIPGPIDEAITIPMMLAKAARAGAPLVGAGVGGGLGEMAQIGIEEKRLLTKMEFAKAFSTELAFEAGGRAVTYGAKFAFSPFIKQTVPEAAEVVSDFAKAGGVLPPAALDKRISISITEEIMRGSFGARQVMQDMGEKNAEAAVVYANLMLDGMADGLARKSTAALGRELGKDITHPRGRIFQILDDLFDPLYKLIDDMTGEGIVSTRGLKKLALKELRANKRVLKPGRDAAVLLTPEAKKNLETILFDYKDTISFSDMRRLRSKLLRDVRKLKRDVGQDEALVKRIADLTTDALYDAEKTRNISPEAMRLLKNTNNLYAASREGLKTTFPEGLAKRLIQHPSRVTKMLFTDAEAIKNIRISLCEPVSGMPSTKGKALWAQLRTAYFADAVEQATKEGQIKPQIFESALRTLRKDGLAELIPDANGKEQLRKIRALLHAMNKKPMGGASLFIRGGQVGGALMVYDGMKDGDWVQVAAGGTLVMGPITLAKLAAHPLGSRLLTTGVNIKPGSTSLVPVTARIINLLRKIDRQDAKAIFVGETRQTIKYPTLPELRGHGGRGF